MNPKIDELPGRIKALEDELEQELAARQAELRFRLENRKVRFEQRGWRGIASSRSSCCTTWSAPPGDTRSRCR